MLLAGQSCLVSHSLSGRYSLNQSAKNTGTGASSFKGVKDSVPFWKAEQPEQGNNERAHSSQPPSNIQYVCDLRVKAPLQIHHNKNLDCCLLYLSEHHNSSVLDPPCFIFCRKTYVLTRCFAKKILAVSSSIDKSPAIYHEFFSVAFFWTLTIPLWLQETSISLSFCYYLVLQASFLTLSFTL